MARLAAHSMRANAICRACGAAIGTLWHRMGECPATQEEREGRSGCPRWLLRKGKLAIWDPLFSRGVPALPKVPAPPPEREQWGPGGRPGDGALATGDVYTDGALSGRWRRIMRGGWGIVALHSDRDEAIWALHGTCHELQPSVVRSELRAVLEALRLAAPPLRLHIDNKEVVDGFTNGRSWCTEPGRDGADLWRQIWDKWDDIGIGIENLKVKAHTDEYAVDEGLISARDRLGNMLADREAREGAKLSEMLSPTSAARGELAKAVRWHSWSRRLAAIWADDIGQETEEDKECKGMREVDTGIGRRAASGLRHMLWKRADMLACRRCDRKADTPQKVRDLRSSRCLGSAAGRLVAKTCGDAGALSRMCAISRGDLLQRGWKAVSAEDTDSRPPDARGDWFDEEGDEDEGSDTFSETAEEADGSMPEEVHIIPAPLAGSHGGDAHPPPQRRDPQEAASSAAAARAATASSTDGEPQFGSLLAPAGQSIAANQGLGLAQVEAPWHGEGRAKESDGSAAQLPIWMEDPPWLYLPHLRPLHQAASGSTDAAAATAVLARSRKRGLALEAASTHPGAPGSQQRKRSKRVVGAGTAGEAAEPEAVDMPQSASSSSRLSAEAATEAAGGQGGVQRSRKTAREDTVPPPRQVRRRRESHVVGSDAAEEQLRERSTSLHADAESERRWGRRYLTTLGDPVQARDSQGHQLRLTGSLIWCAACGRYAARRIGRALRNQCVGTAEGVYHSRLARLRQGLHPITGGTIPR